jgi:hypothetical protein
MEFNTYKEYNDQEQVDALVKILVDNKIQYLITHDRDSLDGLYGKDSSMNNYSVKIKPEDFDRANSILQNLSEQSLTSIDQDHYLFAFSDDELLDILAKPDEWNEYDYVLAKKILAGRGEDVSEQHIEKLKGARIQKLMEHATISPAWIVIAYISAFLGGVLGLFTGWHLNKSMKVLPNGRRIYSYSEEVRNHGMQMMLIGGAVLALALVVYLVQDVIRIR